MEKDTLDGKGKCISGYYLLKIGGCLSANLPTYQRIVNILLEAVGL